jgi:hypothetical protein
VASNFRAYPKTHIFVLKYRTLTEVAPMTVCLKEAKTEIAKRSAASKRPAAKPLPVDYQEMPRAHVVSLGCSVEMIGLPGEK